MRRFHNIRDIKREIYKVFTERLQSQEFEPCDVSKDGQLKAILKGVGDEVQKNTTSGNRTKFPFAISILRLKHRYSDLGTGKEEQSPSEKISEPAGPGFFTEGCCHS